MEKTEYIQKFGYTEMYEWAKPSEVAQRLGIFVQFDSKYPDKITPYEGGEMIGVSTINSTIVSDNPEKWKYADMCNEVGDLYLRKEKLAVGQKVYDEVLEFNYIVTRPWEHFITIQNDKYDPDKRYIPRTARPEWVKVNLIGKCIVFDDGNCKPGQYCKPYEGKLKQKLGTAIPVENTESYKGLKYYVLNRVSDKTITILFK